MNTPESSSNHSEKLPAHPQELGAILLRFDELSSTNDYARDLAIQGLREGVAVIARKQTAGKGRQGRNWSSPLDEGLYLSIILRPQTVPARGSLITLAAAIAVAETLRLDFAAPADIKWPNDILLNGRKICGILVESSIENNRLQYAILGIGVNLAQKTFPDELQKTATSLFLETQSEITPADFLPPLLARLNHWYAISISQPESIISRWQELSSFARDCAVCVISHDTIVEGITRGLTTSGALLVELDNGELREIVSGEVSLRKSLVPSP
jgi:BirA family transcriptional regulator, biotin operon repressor / biotin---[acetyl-CoA-carboxylase] ligase